MEQRVVLMETIPLLCAQGRVKPSNWQQNYWHRSQIGAHPILAM